MMRCVVIIPAYNEEAAVGDVIRRVPRVIDDAVRVSILVIDDGSTDGTAAVAKAAGADEVISFSANRGLGAAIREGLRLAHARGADVAVMIDADGEYPPEAIPELVRPILRGEAITCWARASRARSAGCAFRAALGTGRLRCFRRSSSGGGFGTARRGCAPSAGRRWAMWRSCTITTMPGDDAQPRAQGVSPARGAHRLSCPHDGHVVYPLWRIPAPRFAGHVEGAAASGSASVGAATPRRRRQKRHRTEGGRWRRAAGGVGASPGYAVTGIGPYC